MPQTYLESTLSLKIQKAHEPNDKPHILLIHATTLLINSANFTALKYYLKQPFSLLFTTSVMKISLKHATNAQIDFEELVALNGVQSQSKARFCNKMTDSSNLIHRFLYSPYHPALS